MTVIDNIFDKVTRCIQQLGDQFTTYDVIQVFRQRYPNDWSTLEQKYGRGGRGSGRFYTSHNYIASRLVNLSKPTGRRPNPLIKQLKFQSAPIDWGNLVIATWRKQ